MLLHEIWPLPHVLMSSLPLARNTLNSIESTKLDTRCGLFCFMNSSSSWNLHAKGKTKAILFHRIYICFNFLKLCFLCNPLWNRFPEINIFTFSKLAQNSQNINSWNPCPIRSPKHPYFHKILVTKENPKFIFLRKYLLWKDFLKYYKWYKHPFSWFSLIPKLKFRGIISIPFNCASLLTVIDLSLLIEPSFHNSSR